MDANTKGTCGLALRVALFVVAIAAVGYLSLSPGMISELWSVFDEPVATQPTE